MQPDFSLMYSELGLSPDCSLEEFQRAHRRRIAELHPDRKGGEPPSQEAEEELAALIAAHVAVSRFHSRHGRMPGAAPRGGAAGTAGDGGRDRLRRPAAPRAGLPLSMPAGNEPDRSNRPTWRLVIVFLALLALLASWDWLTLASQ